MTTCLSLLVYIGTANAKQIRISGEDRYETAAKVSQQGWKSADTVVLAQGLDFPDALASVPLARKLDAPILLTRPEQLPPSTITEIKRLGAKQVIILGGPAAISQGIENYLANTMKLSVKRIGGETRFKTAEAIAAEMGEYDQVFIVNAYNFPDALSIAPYAANTGSPILVTRQDEMPQEIKQAAEKGTKRYVIGGPMAVNDQIQTELKAKRIAGENRYETSANIVKTFYKIQPELYFATGMGFADALTGSALAAKHQSAVVLVKPNEIPTEITDIFDDYQLTTSVILGGNMSVSDTVSSDLDKQLIYEASDRSKPIIFYAPHSDDELLAEGAGIDYYLNKGFDVHVVLLTKGTASVVYNRLLTQFPEMTLAEFGEARVAEFRDSLSRLEVKPDHIHVYDFPDSKLTSEDVMSVIMEFEQKYPGAEHRALSYNEANPDHRATGIALNNLYWSGMVKNARFYIAPYPENTSIKGFYVAPLNESKVKDAVYAYKLYDPESGRYAIGHQSVPDMFNAFEQEPISKVHLPDKNYVTASEENEEIVK
jgi:putative cell wall-binding protein